MLLSAEPQDYKYILLNNTDRITVFAFRGNKFLPCHLIKIYEHSGKSHLERMYAVLKKINLSNSEVLRDSTPRLLHREQTNKYYLIYEEYIEGMNMEKYAQSKSPFWKRNFYINLALITRWLSQLHKNFAGGGTKLDADRISFLLKETKEFLDISFLSIALKNIEIPTVLSHTDLRPRNIIRRRQKIVVADWDKFKPEGLPLFDLLNFILRYLHAHYKFQKEKIYLEPKVFLKYFNLFYLQKDSISRVVKEKINFYSQSIGLSLEQTDALLLLWLYSMLYIEDKQKFSLL
jgi:hypothetical protein